MLGRLPKTTPVMAQYVLLISAAVVAGVGLGTLV